MGTKRKLDADRGSVTLPQQVDLAAVDASSKWLVLKVDPALDWRAAFNGARLRLKQGVALSAPSCQTPLRARLCEDGWCCFLVLCPRSPGDYRLRVVSSRVPVVEISEHTKELEKANAAAGAVEEQRRVVRAAEAEQHTQSLKAEAESRADRRRRIGIRSSLREALESIAWHSGSGMETVLAADDWDGSGRCPVPAAPPSQHSQADAEANLNFEEPIHFRAIPAQSDGPSTMPLVFWRACPVEPEAFSQLQFRIFLKARSRSFKGHQELLGRFADAPGTRIIGTPVKRPRPPFGHRYLVGVQMANSKRLMLCEADLYDTHCDGRAVPAEGAEAVPSAVVEAEDAAAEGKPVDKMKSYFTARSEAVNAFGAAKSIRMQKVLTERKFNKKQVMDEDQCMELLNQRAEAQQAKATTIEKKDEQLKRQLLPPWDAGASDPWQIYTKGLERIAPKDLVDVVPDLADAGLVKMLLGDPRALLVPTGVPGCSKHLVQAVVAERARRGLQAQSLEDAQALARRIGVLDRLLSVYGGGARKSGGKCKAKGVAELAALPEDCRLVIHWYRTYWDAMLINSPKRAFNGRKLLCAIVVWALHLTPQLLLTLNLSKELEEELHQPRTKIVTAFEYVGCSAVVGDSANPYVMTMQLQSPPKVNEKYYESQVRPPRGKRR